VTPVEITVEKSAKRRARRTGFPSRRDYRAGKAADPRQKAARPESGFLGHKNLEK